MADWPTIRLKGQVSVLIGVLIGMSSSLYSVTVEARMGCPEKEFNEIRDYIMAREAFSAPGKGMEASCARGWDMIELFHPERWTCVTNDELRKVIQGDQARIALAAESLPLVCGQRCTVEDYTRHQRFTAGLEELRISIRLSDPNFCAEGLDLMELFRPYRQKKCTTHGSGKIYDMGVLVGGLSDVLVKYCPEEFKARRK